MDMSRPQHIVNPYYQAQGESSGNSGNSGNSQSPLPQIIQAMPALVNPLAKQADVSSANRRPANPNSLRSLLSGRGGAARDDQDAVSNSNR